MSNITEVSKPTQWKPGQSGNLNGRPVGTRQAFSAGFLRDLAEVWSEEGRETMVKTARTNPAVFFATCARLIPNDVRVTVEQQLPGNLSVEDWQVMKEIIAAVRQAIPDASSARRHPSARERVIGKAGRCLSAADQNFRKTFETARKRSASPTIWRASLRPNAALAPLRNARTRPP